MTKVREAAHMVAFVDEYCNHYRALFANVRYCEQFSALHVGLLAETKRKSLPRLAKTAKADAQALHHFLANAEWSATELRAKRLDLLRAALGGRAFILCLDETGDRKKGKTTDYVAHQYIGNSGAGQRGGLGQRLRGGRRDPFPLAFRVYKPQSRLKPSDVFKSKPQLAIELIQELHALGFRFSVVLADSMYGESGEFTAALHRLGLQYVVAIRSNHPVWTGPGGANATPAGAPSSASSPSASLLLALQILPKVGPMRHSFRRRSIQRRTRRTRGPNRSWE